MQTALFVLCAIAGYTLAQPVIATMRSIAATRAQHSVNKARSHAAALRAIRTMKAR